MTTNVPLPVFSPTGLVIASEQAILAGIQQDYVQAFALNGKTLSTELTTPQGQLMQSQAFMVAAFEAAMAQVIASVDPLTSFGSYQDALGRIYFLTRQPATAATVAAQVSGIEGNVLPAGSQAVSGDNSVWLSAAPVTFPAGGAPIGVTFVAQVLGSVPAAGINDLRIYQAVAGWQAVNNAAPSSPGADEETRQQFEIRRSESVSIGGTGSAPSLKAAIGQVAGVSDVFIYNNSTNATVNYGATAYPVPAHSVAISVQGGTDAAVANAIWSKLPTGCGMSTSATTLVTIQDTVNYSPPYPSYDIRFIRPAATQVYITVNVANLSNLPANFVVQVQAVVAAAFANGFISNDGTISVPKAKIGSQIVAAEYAAPILTLPGIVPVSLFVGFSPSPSSGASVTMGIDQLPVCPALNITVNAV
jgi:hypothetical protein